MAITTDKRKRAAHVRPEGTGPHLTTDLVWRQLEGASFAVVGYVTPAGEPRSSGVMYKVVKRRLYTVVAPDSWKARHIVARNHVSVTVPVHRGGVLAHIAPIPPATISFHASAFVHPVGSVRIAAVSKQLESWLPADRKDSGALVELIPEGQFLTYGVGTSLRDMQKPELAGASVPVVDCSGPEVQRTP